MVLALQLRLDGLGMCVRRRTYTRLWDQRYRAQSATSSLSPETDKNEEGSTGECDSQQQVLWKNPLYERLDYHK